MQGSGQAPPGARRRSPTRTNVACFSQLTKLNERRERGPVDRAPHTPPLAPTRAASQPVPCACTVRAKHLRRPRNADHAAIIPAYGLRASQRDRRALCARPPRLTGRTPCALSRPHTPVRVPTHPRASSRCARFSRTCRRRKARRGTSRTIRFDVRARVAAGPPRHLPGARSSTARARPCSSRSRLQQGESLAAAYGQTPRPPPSSRSGDRSPATVSRR